MITKENYWEMRSLKDDCKMSIPQISTELSIDKKTVQKWLNKDFFMPQERNQKASVLDEHKESIKGMLHRCDYSAVQVFQELKTKGYTGGITTVRDFVRSVRISPKKVYGTLDFAKGEVAQVDFGYCGYIYVGSAKRRLYVFSIVLCYSRRKFIKFIMKQNQEHFLKSHQEAFEYFGGIPQKIMVDNCKVTVLKNPKYGSYTLNSAYAEFAKYHGFKISPCGVRKPYEKGRVEKSIDYIKRNFLRGFEVTTLDAVNFAAMNWLNNIANVRIHSTTKRKPDDMFKEEKEYLISLPVNPYDCGILKNVKSNSQYRIHFEGNRYSVPSLYATSHLAIKIYPEKLLFYYDNDLIARHERCYDSNKDIVDDNHNKEFLKEKLKAREQKELAEFFRIDSNAELFYKELKRLCRPLKKEVKRILALKDIYSRGEIGVVLGDCLELGAVNSSAVENILATKKRVIKSIHPLHITRNSECLDIKIDKPDLNVYNNLTN